MGKYLALLRGVNVGGVALKMETLREILAYIGFGGIRTYIQSGNAIFESRESNKKMMAAQIRDELKHRAGIDTPVIVLSAGELAGIAASHPFANLGPEENLYVTVLEYEPKREDVENLLGTMNAVDTHEFAGRVVYTHYGQGYGESKRSNNFIEKMLKVSATTRNWRTISALDAIARDPSLPSVLDAPT